jgi:methylamine dehydrogenase accessory protein MauD
METIWLVSYILLWLLVLFLGFVVLGMLRTLGVLTWRLEQLVATTPRRIGRDGLKKGARAPDFTLLSVAGMEVSLRDFAGKKVFLAFTSSGCGPCHALLPELVRFQKTGPFQVVVVNGGSKEESRQMANKAGVNFPVLVEGDSNLQRRYQIVTTPFVFVINEQGIVAAKGIALNQEHLSYLLADATEKLPQPVEEQRPGQGEQEGTEEATAASTREQVAASEAVS